MAKRGPKPKTEPIGIIDSPNPVVGKGEYTRNPSFEGNTGIGGKAIKGENSSMEFEADKESMVKVDTIDLDNTECSCNTTLEQRLEVLEKIVGCMGQHVFSHGAPGVIKKYRAEAHRLKDALTRKWYELEEKPKK